MGVIHEGRDRGRERGTDREKTDRRIACKRVNEGRDEAREGDTN